MAYKVLDCDGKHSAEAQKLANTSHAFLLTTHTSAEALQAATEATEREGPTQKEDKRKAPEALSNDKLRRKRRKQIQSQIAHGFQCI